MFFCINRLNLLFKTSLLLASLSFFIPALGKEPESIEDKIQLAEELKATDFNRFNELLKQVEDSSVNLTAEQHEQFRFLDAYRLAYSGSQTQAVANLTELVKVAKSEKVQFKSLSVLLNILIISRDYSEVFQYLEQYDQMQKNITDKDLRQHALGILALVFNQTSQFDIGYFYANKLSSDAVDGKYACFGMQFKLESLHRLKKYDEFDQEFDAGVATCEAAKQPIYSKIIQSYRVERLLEVDPNQAISLLNSLYQDVEQTSYNVLITLYKTLYSIAYLRNEQLDVAKEYGLSATKNIKEDDINYAILLLYSTLYEIEKANGNFEKALTYHEVLVSKQKAYDDEKAAGLLAYNIAKANVEVKNQRIALLDKDNELLSLQKDLYEKEARQNRLLVLILGAIPLLATVLAYRGLTGRSRFKKIAEYDQLTGISNRYHFNNQAKIALDYCETNAKPVALILFDLDYFKDINDTHGHAVGDWALRAVVKTCRNFMRNNDVFGRIGGEEFAVVLPGCQTDKAVLLAEICRDAIAGIDTTESGKHFSLSASFGVSGSDNSGYQLKQLLADADSAMYSAKAAGRNQVATFSE